MEKLDATPETMQAVVRTLKLVNDLEGEIK